MQSIIKSSSSSSSSVTFIRIRQFSTSSTLFNNLSNSNKTIVSEEDASKSAPLVALHKRLNLPNDYKLGTLTRALTCRSSRGNLANNYGLNILGKNFLSYYVNEYLLSKYPRLPLPVLNTAVSSYISTESLHNVGKYSWGIEIDETPILNKILNEEPKEYSLGKLRFLPINQIEETGITKLTSKSKDEINSSSAYALGVRSIIGGLYISTQSEDLTKKFIYDHIISRKLDLSKMFEFEQPTRELSRLCKREGLTKPIAKLLVENGRLSDKPIYVVGVFSGEEKLGESYGSSLNEAKIRASVNALKNWYLYKPLNNSVPSDKDYKPSIIDHGIVIV
ncbi:hypothetical protein WICMUC_000879 [Wickerhamomyces mucosus]|uniref:Large ribosomal subunit protein mL44 n=1 Tax=Wickerhamomyces mucosus TaxID=1378264 RepID=A0A9P8TI03_9ASCO|nr:hypothetical protein WICMUC_000879 [Wickerhamomyces mucosus]